MIIYKHNTDTNNYYIIPIDAFVGRPGEDVAAVGGARDDDPRGGERSLCTAIAHTKNCQTKNI